jgi:hypothetical protein
MFEDHITTADAAPGNGEAPAKGAPTRRASLRRTLTRAAG